MTDPVSGERDQDDEDRERYRELLEELRTIIPGAQVLLAFLLTVPFASRFGEVDDLGRGVFAASLVTSAAATILFLAPAAYHRVAHRDSRRRRIAYGAGMVVAGMSLIAVAVTCAVFVVLRHVFGSDVVAVVVAVAIAAITALLWFLIPAARARAHDG